MKILITGNTGFIGSNLVKRLNEMGYYDIVGYNTESSPEELCDVLKDCDFIYHLAAVHRPNDDREFMLVNCGLLSDILYYLDKYNNECPIVLSSSIHAGQNGFYAESKKSAERLLLEFGSSHKNRVVIYRLTNTFGPNARPNGHSVVANFCYNITHNLPIYISDRKREMDFFYIGDVVQELVEQIDSDYNSALSGIKSTTHISTLHITLGELADKLISFSKSDNCLTQHEGFEEKLYLTFCSYYDEVDSRR